MSFSDSGVHDATRLKELQALPLDRKIAMTQARIIEWFNFWEGDVYVSFSGGKDSTVLLDLVIKTIKAIDPTFEVPVVFSNTGLEYPEIQRFARSKNATFVTPKMNFVEVIRTYGYPLISKEVASAIYYARRIRNSNAFEGGAERGFKETKHRREELLDKRYDQIPPPEQFKTAIRKRQELRDRRIDNCNNSTDSCSAGELQTKTAPWDSG